MRQLAGHEVSVVALRHGDDHVGIGGPGCAQYRRRRRIADHRSQVEPVLQLGESLPVVVDDRDVVFFGDQALGNACAEPVYSSLRLPSLTSNCLSFR